MGYSGSIITITTVSLTPSHLDLPQGQAITHPPSFPQPSPHTTPFKYDPPKTLISSPTKPYNPAPRTNP